MNIELVHTSGGRGFVWKHLDNLSISTPTQFWHKANDECTAEVRLRMTARADAIVEPIISSAKSKPNDFKSTML